MPWIYKPVWSHDPLTQMTYDNLDEFINWRNLDGDSPFEDIKEFLKAPDVAELIKKDDWVSVFKKWDNATFWVPDILADFFYYARIDFWNYLPDDYYSASEDSFRLMDGLEKV